MLTHSVELCFSTSVLVCLCRHGGDYYTVVFGVSRALGCLSNGIWARVYGLPIERPNSIDMTYI